MKECESERVKDLENRFIAYKIRGLNIKTINKSPFSEEAVQYVTVFVEASGLKLIKDLLTFGDFVFSTIISKDAFLLSQLYNYYVFILDDYLERNPDESEKYAKYFIERECPTNTPYERLLHFYFCESKRLANEEFIQPFHQLVIRWLEHFSQRQNFTFGKDKFTDQEFINMRLIDVGAAAEMYFIVLDSGLKVTEQVVQNTEYLALTEMASRHALLLNELFSFVKEAKVGQLEFNYVFIKMKNNKLTLKQSMDAVVAELQEIEGLAHLYANKLIARNNENLTKYVKGIIGVFDGNAFWSTICLRYNNLEYNFYDNNNND